MAKAISVETALAKAQLNEDLTYTRLLTLLSALVVVVSSVVLAVVSARILLFKIARPARRIAVELEKLAGGGADIRVDNMLLDTELGAIAKAAKPSAKT